MRAATGAISVWSTGCPSAEPFGYMWECPDLAVLDGQPLLICCPQGIPHQPFCYQNAHQCGCFALEGDFAAGAALGAFQPFDYGFDLYAARTLKASDGRVLLFAWMGMSETSYGRNPSASQGWDQAIAMPRELSWKDGHLWQRPLAELEALRGPRTRQDGREAARFHSRRCELVVRPDAGQDVTVHLYEDAVLRFCAAEGLLTLEMGPVCGGGARCAADEAGQAGTAGAVSGRLDAGSLCQRRVYHPDQPHLRGR